MGGPSGRTSSRDAFQERLRRLSRQKGWDETEATPETDESALDIDARNRAALASSRAISRRLAEMEQSAKTRDLLTAFVLGMIAGALAWVIRYHTAVLGPLGHHSVTPFYLVDGTLAAFMAIAASWLIGLRSQLMASASILGILFMLGIFHNFAHWMPGRFEAVFSAEYAERMQQATEPNSFRIGRFVFLFGGHPEQSQETVDIRELLPPDATVIESKSLREQFRELHDLGKN